MSNVPLAGKSVERADGGRCPVSCMRLHVLVSRLGKE